MFLVVTWQRGGLGQSCELGNISLLAFPAASPFLSLPKLLSAFEVPFWLPRTPYTLCSVGAVSGLGPLTALFPSKSWVSFRGDSSSWLMPGSPLGSP